MTVAELNPPSLCGLVVLACLWGTPTSSSYADPPAGTASTGCVMNNSCPTPGPGSPTERGMRYCRWPSGPGAYLAASPDVSCSTALKAEHKLFTAPCVKRKACEAYGFLCLAYWAGRYDRPFSYTHHAICRSPRGRRIEADEG